MIPMPERRRKASTAVAVTAGQRLVEELQNSLPSRMGVNGPERAEFTEIELALVDLLRRQADDVERLEQQLATDGLIVLGSQGQSRMNPLITELRLSRMALVRILAELRMPDEGPTKNRTKQRAARARWDREAASA